MAREMKHQSTNIDEARKLADTMKEISDKYNESLTKTGYIYLDDMVAVNAPGPSAPPIPPPFVGSKISGSSGGGGAPGNAGGGNGTVNNGGGGGFVPWFAPAAGIPPKKINPFDIDIEKLEGKKIIIYNEEQLRRMKENVVWALIAEIVSFENDCVDDMYKANLFEGVRAERAAVVKAIRKLRKQLSDEAIDKICKKAD